MFITWGAANDHLEFWRAFIIYQAKIMGIFRIESSKYFVSMDIYHLSSTLWFIIGFHSFTVHNPV